jgi:hypothetical protein
MTEQRALISNWEGEAVMILDPMGQTITGILDEVNDWGVMVTTMTDFWWFVEPPQQGSEEGETVFRRKDAQRVLPVFRPWHTISLIRVLTGDELEAHGF